MKLPSSLRIKLKKPLGPIGFPPKGQKIIAVGDISSFELIKRGYNPWMIIFDGKEQRQPVKKDVQKAIESWAKGKKIEEVKNPAGMISDDAFQAIKRMVKSGGGIKVEGEEDLLAIPSVIFAEKGWYVCYGQPNRGMVCIKVEEKVKKEFENILKQMEGNE